ncbi:hypothetical protein [Paenibacillus sp. MSJ-34]|uniref:hypothetical protein n=1 Tax=Paenibacillus sp. MSJ-34 TaxID=2841529 RepID=UPI001C12550E|nr:hypothetical protein [Paenibacillus sp. MSJ-34]MBU5441730.1 hypothetical protein [Paenibacillus sp. MSJ-34]
MTNIERLKIETKGINYPDDELSIYLQENGLHSNDVYNPQSNSNKKAIYVTALALLESLANQPQLFKSYKLDDITVYDFADNLQKRITQLDRKLRMMASSDDNNGNGNGSVFMLFDA